jgi:hypothetical protein
MEPLKDVTVTEGSESCLFVCATGTPNPTIEWHKGNTKLKPDKRYVLKTEENGSKFSLTITDCKSVDQGVYKAVLKNKVGSIETNEATLNVTSKNDS